MAGLYGYYLQDNIGADADLINLRVVAAAIDLSQGYTVNLSTDEYLSDLPAGSIKAAVSLTGKSRDVYGQFRADDTVFRNYVTDDPFDAVLIYIDTGFTNSSRLVYYDADAGAGYPLVGDGDDITIRWPDPIFRLGV